ncbi:DNA polymerase [Amycolatopsis sp.]|uniref:DNA polymerase n=1 Tax=Amycolatopsis sp. TaxID=37632 RepID=UPI002C279020|nr:DNA polymerase [Amycolatopsis sp.]HVV11618.1 DNA polymerase [Amycolatopsis sp.]
MGRTLIFDIETHERGLLETMAPEKFVRLIGYRWADWTKGRTEITTDLEEIREYIREARWIIGHNIHDFDLRAVFGIDSNEPVELAMQKRVYDTWTHAALVNPAPYTYINRFGKPALADKPDKAKKWFSLDEQAYQLGVQGKSMDLAELAREFGDPELKGKAREVDGYGRIPVDDERYVHYLRHDVLASEAVAKALLKKGPLNEYALREQEIEARKAVISSNGWVLNREKAQARVDSLAERREAILKDLQEHYGLPSEGPSPWDTNEGKVAILAALADHGITPDTVDWPSTPVADKEKEYLKATRAKIERLKADARDWWEEAHSGDLPKRSVDARLRWVEKARLEVEELEANPLPPAFGLSLSGDTLKALTKGTTAEDLGSALAELKGQRSLAQLALDSCHSDGRVHPEITMLQRSGRWSTTKPGLTVWTNNGPGAVEKDYFLPDSEDDVLMEFDLSNADARAVAAESGDRRYTERFKPGADGHLINAWAAWGKDVVGTDKHDPVTHEYRQKAKPMGHGWSYGGQPKALAAQAGLPLEVAEEFCAGMNKEYRVLVQWQNEIRKFARRHGYVVNDWGRVMPIEKGREFTQAPALIGQSTTREIVCDVLLRMPLHILRRVKAQIHDALVLSIPRKNWEACRDYVLKLMWSAYEPKHGRGQRMEFPADAGPPGESWFEAIH